MVFERKNKKKILKYLSGFNQFEEPKTVKEISDATELSINTTYDLCSKLSQIGLLFNNGTSSTGGKPNFEQYSYSITIKGAISLERNYRKDLIEILAIIGGSIVVGRLNYNFFMNTPEG